MGLFSRVKDRQANSKFEVLRIEALAGHVQGESLATMRADESTIGYDIVAVGEDWATQPSANAYLHLTSRRILWAVLGDGDPFEMSVYSAPLDEVTVCESSAFDARDWAMQATLLFNELPNTVFWFPKGSTLFLALDAAVKMAENWDEDRDDE